MSLSIQISFQKNLVTSKAEIWLATEVGLLNKKKEMQQKWGPERVGCMQSISLSCERQRGYFQVTPTQEKMCLKWFVYTIKQRWHNRISSQSSSNNNKSNNTNNNDKRTQDNATKRPKVLKQSS